VRGDPADACRRHTPAGPAFWRGSRRQPFRMAVCVHASERQRAEATNRNLWQRLRHPRSPRSRRFCRSGQARLASCPGAGRLQPDSKLQTVVQFSTFFREPIAAAQRPSRVGWRSTPMLPGSCDHGRIEDASCEGIRRVTDMELEDVNRGAAAFSTGFFAGYGAVRLAQEVSE
jgi:hypothetical protein